MRITMAALAAGGMLTSGALAGAWPAPKGRVSAISSISYDVADRLFADEGDAGAPLDFEKIETSMFLEWGATERLTFVVQPVVQSVAIRPSGGPPDVGSGVASSQIGARWLVAEGAAGVFSLQGGLIAPGRAENALNARLGDGGPAVEARALFGRGWNTGFVEAQAGRRWRNDRYPEETRLDFAIGYRPRSNIMILGQNFSTFAEEEPVGRPLESHKAQISVVFDLNENWSVQVGARGAYAGRNVVEERGVFISTWRQWGVRG